MSPQLVALLMAAPLACLGGLLVWTHIFYQRQIESLVDRLMSRNLHEFEQAKHPPLPRVIVKHEPPHEDFDRILG